MTGRNEWDVLLGRNNPPLSLRKNWREMGDGNEMNNEGRRMRHWPAAHFSYR